MGKTIQRRGLRHKCLSSRVVRDFAQLGNYVVLNMPVDGVCLLPYCTSALCLMSEYLKTKTFPPYEIHIIFLNQFQIETHPHVTHPGNVYRWGS